MKLFVDTSILLDVLVLREPFYADSARVWTLVETGAITGFVSVLSLPNLCYLLRRSKGQAAARNGMATLRNIFALVPLEVQLTHQAIDADIDDFEDAVQFFVALRCGASVLLTRNPKGFPRPDVPVQTPSEFLAVYRPN